MNIHDQEQLVTRNRLAFLEESGKAIIDFLEQLETVLEAQEQLDMSQGVSNVWNQFVREVRRIIPTDALALVAAKPEMDKYSIQNVYPKQSIPQFRQEYDYHKREGTLSWVLKRKTIIILPAHCFGSGDEGKNVVLVPLYTIRNTLGILFIITNITEESITQGMLNILTVMAKQYSYAMENALLYYDLEKYNETLEKKVIKRTRTLEKLNLELTQANKELKELDRLKSEFLSSITHELISPLNSIIGSLQLVLEGLCESPEEEHEFTQESLNQSQHLLELIKSVLEISEINANQIKLSLEIFDLGIVFNEVYLDSLDQARENNIDLSFKLQDNKEINVYADYEKVKEILNRLVDNSLKFTPSGSITVTAEVTPDKKFVMVKVIDTGIGIPVEKQKEIREKLVKLDTSDTRRYGGLGLGIAISKELIEMMGGTINIFSSGVNEGTTVSFTLPTPWRNNCSVD